MRDNRVTVDDLKDVDFINFTEYELEHTQGLIKEALEANRRDITDEDFSNLLDNLSLIAYELGIRYNRNFI